MKSRGMYETPGGEIYARAHRGIESITLDRGAAHLKDELMPKYAELIYNGFWWSPEYRAAAALRVGAVDVDCCRLAGRPIPASHEAVLVLVFRAARQRDRHNLHSAPEGKLLGTLLTVVLGSGVWAAFLMGGLHVWLVGVMPFTRAG